MLLMRSGMTLIELTVVIAALMTLITVLFPMANAWKRGASRAECLLNIRQVQMAVRSFSNLNGFGAGRDVSTANPPVALQTELVGADKYLEMAPTCPSSGTYIYGGNVIPLMSSLYMTCSLAASDEHEPNDVNGW